MGYNPEMASSLEEYTPKLSDLANENHRLKTELATLRALVREIYCIASGENQIALDDTEGMKVIVQKLLSHPEAKKLTVEE